MNIQQQTTLEVDNTETVMDYNEDQDPLSTQDISNVYAAADFMSHSSPDSAKYKRTCLKAKVIRYYISSSVKCPYARSRALSAALNHK